MTTRQPAVCGSFYPEQAKELELSVGGMLSAAASWTKKSKALIVPHAGYMYSGEIAASAYRCMDTVSASIKRVVLLGPSHRVAFSGIATPGCDAFLTPLGSVPLDQNIIQEIERHPDVLPIPLAHEKEHSLEVHLPFLQTVLTDFSIVPLVVGDVEAPIVAELIETLWQDDETFIIVSTDLSHFLPYEKAQIKDQETNEHIVALNDQLNGEQACGSRPLNGFLQTCKKKQLTITNVDLRNSGDTAGSKDRVVGYGAYVVH